MDIVKDEESNFALPPARDLLRTSSSLEEKEDNMMIDEPFTEINKKPFLPSMQAISSQTDDYIRHRMSDMSVSQQPQQQHHQYEPIVSTKALSPLEPSSQQSYYEPLSYSRRGSVTDPAAFHNHSFRRPSITDMSNLPLPNSTVVSRRGSIATTDYDYSSRSPSPSPFSSSKRYHENDAAAPHPYALNNNNRRDSLPNNNLHHPYPSNNNNSNNNNMNTKNNNGGNAYDPYQRRHSIATAESTYNHGNRNSNPSSTKYRAFKFPATIQESPNYRTYSAPPSPPQSALSNVGHQEFLHENKELKHNGILSRKNSISRLPYTTNGGGPMLPSRRRPSILDDLNDGPSAEHLLVRRASMPVVTSLHRNHYDRSNIPPPPPLPQQPPPPQQNRLHELKNEDNGESYSNRHESVSDSIMIEEDKRKETPYSRSPELRISHKLAERKRRKEMKDLFDELRDSLPVEKNMKTTVEYISLLKRHDYDMETEISGLRREIDMIKRERGNSSSNHGPSFA
ncbi:hypothetical protein INT46_007385 [Mucor plumbeus]|uniref:BHLH domain-containing protein n=1 Tax=Mucor plumbeus TaxID=97098 RepID=A0A8H7VBM2_9FUNG|nr:hypothetical protein INT46_007385 [Mucor plumbeus]